eukprot:tig00000655_g2847.t1
MQCFSTGLPATAAARARLGVIFGSCTSSQLPSPKPSRRISRAAFYGAPVRFERRDDVEGRIRFEARASVDPAPGVPSHSVLSGAILSQFEILKAIEEGEIKILPNFDPSQVGPASIDLTLSSEFRAFKRGIPLVKVDSSTESESYKDITDLVSLKDGEPFYLAPGEVCLGMTEEIVHLSPRLCGLLEGRSRFARLGIFVHITAGFMNPGINNRQVLEIFNSSPNTIALYPGTKICQFVFMRMAGEATYRGSFQNQSLL